TAARALAAILAELRPVPGAVESVERVKAAGRAVAVASSSDPRRLATLLDGVGILPLVAPHAYSTALVARGKPAPDIFLHAADRLGVRPADCTVIEDTTTGVAAGVAAGMRVIGFLGGGHAGPELGARLRATGAGTLARDHATLGAMLLELAA
ncbi:MAG: HAD family phosphatase, partial [Alphaproteobacteria bacterium]|nr:HAD family phosphatase [Alphaproteobacteria bacterium]